MIVIFIHNIYLLRKRNDSYFSSYTQITHIYFTKEMKEQKRVGNTHMHTHTHTRHDVTHMSCHKNQKI